MTTRDASPFEESAAERGAGRADPYDVFCSTVALRQVSQWLPLTPGTVLDISRPLADADGPHDYRISDVAMSAGHRVLTVSRDAQALPGRRRPHPVVMGDPRNLDWVRSESVDRVIAEGGALSDCLAAEDAVRGVARVLRPGGRFLASADSLLIGLARLAEQHRWPELADAPFADVVLVPDPKRQAGLLRCFSPQDLRELFVESGLEVEWIRPRTALPATAVRRALEADPSALGELVISELTLAAADETDAQAGHDANGGHGSRQVISGRRPLQPSG